MKIYILILLAFLPLFCNCQASKYKIFGIDLNSDWNSLTNQQSLAYWLQDEDKSSSFVLTDCDYIFDKIDLKFSNLGFKNLRLGFPKGNKGKLEDLKPVFFLAFINYKDNSDYAFKSKSDILKTYTLLKEEFGEPELNMIKDKYSVYKWKGVYFQIILTCREDELSTTLICTKE